MSVKQLFDLSRRTAIITGGSRGLGLQIAEALGEMGAKLALTARKKDELDHAVGHLANMGIAAHAFACDIGKRDGIPGVFDQMLAKLGRVDILVNNAAHAGSTRFEQLGVEEWRLALETNMTAPFLMMRAALPAMKAQQYGRIINISSSAGRMVSTLGGAHYTASKAGLLGLTRAAAKELGRFGVTVNAICPGMIDTELTREHASAELLQRLAASYPVPRLGRPLEVADLICFVASEATGYITGASFNINGGDLMM